MMTNTVEITVLDNADEVEQFLLAAGVQGPSLHPRVHTEDARDRWNGWNKTIGVGVDSAGNAVTVTMHHYASGWNAMSASRNDETGRLGGDHEFVFSGFAWPIQIMPVIRNIRYPEHTPSDTVNA